MDEGKFWSHVQKTDTCWIWKAGRGNGYGQAWWQSRVQYAHRIAYTLTKGKISADLTVDHLCMNRLCVNSDHLELVSREENVRRKNLKSQIYIRRKRRGICEYPDCTRRQGTERRKNYAGTLTVYIKRHCSPHSYLKNRPFEEGGKVGGVGKEGREEGRQ